MNISKWVQDHASGILSLVACVGVAVTAILTYKGTIKAQEIVRDKTTEKNEELTTIETVKASAKPLAPAAVAGVATIGCIVASHKIDEKHIAVLAASAAGMAKKYDDYRKTNIKVNGKEAHDKVMEDLAVQKAREGRITGECMFDICDLNSSMDTEERLFYDAITETYFTSTLSRVMDAEYHMNRNMHVEGGCPDLTVQMWCDFLGIDNKKHDTRGWTVCDSYQWLDFKNSDPVDIGDGLECIIIDCVWEPIEDYDDYDIGDDWPVREPTRNLHPV